MKHKRLLEAALTFGLVAGVLSWLAYRFEASLLDGLIPLFRAELNWLMPTFHIDSLDWRIEHQETVIALSATLSEYRTILHRVFPPGVSINASTLAAHALIHPVLIGSLALSWPGIAFKHKPLLLLAALPGIVLAEMLDIPLMLWGAAEDVLYWQADPARIGESIGSRAQHFLDGGGRYALSIGLTLLAIALWRKVAPRQPSSR